MAVWVFLAACVGMLRGPPTNRSRFVQQYSSTLECDVPSAAVPAYAANSPDKTYSTPPGVGVVVLGADAGSTFITAA